MLNGAAVSLRSGGYLSNYYEFAGVGSCEDVFTLYVLIWTLAGLNLVAFFAGIATTAVLGSVKDLVRHRLRHTFIRNTVHSALIQQHSTPRGTLSAQKYLSPINQKETITNVTIFYL